MYTSKFLLLPGCPGGLVQLHAPDLLELWLPDGGAQLPDGGPAHAAQPGQVRVQRRLRIPPQTRVHVPRGQAVRPFQVTFRVDRTEG